ncbi:MAG TPA: hypothetical protein VGC77_12400 [Rhodopseudomonas sp.]|uniref:hypothetical protein n=1 Tax=Rhodopseudomonas sp. TaxID=1078 RepID=UPI002EDAAC92
MKRKPKNILPHGVFVVDGEGDNAFWTKVGAAWPHEDGKGFNITLTATPVSGRLVIREPKPVEGHR